MDEEASPNSPVADAETCQPAGSGVFADRVFAEYLIETAQPLEQAVAAMAGEQSTGTFVEVPGETDGLRLRHAARVEKVDELETVDSPTLPGALPNTVGASAEGILRARVVLSFPVANMGASLPNLMAAVAGNLFELREVSGLRLIDLKLPEAFGDAYPGPRYGGHGTRELTGVADRPIIGTIIKPSVGLTPQETANLVDQLVASGLDFIKDDELQSDGPSSPFQQRVAAVMDVVNRHADRTGKKAMYAFNITGEIDDMLRRHDAVVKAGGTCVMLSLNHVGLAAVAHIRRLCQLPIHGHRNGWGMLTRCPLLGMDFAAYQKLWRLVGVDHLHCNGLRNKFWEPDDSVVRSARACRTPLFQANPMIAMPVISSGQWAGQAPDTYAHLRTTDLMYLCGGGIIGHPSGIAAGVASVKQAWEAAIADVKLSEYAKSHSELREALDYFAT